MAGNINMTQAEVLGCSKASAVNLLSLTYLEKCFVQKMVAKVVLITDQMQRMCGCGVLIHK